MRLSLIHSTMVSGALTSCDRRVKVCSPFSRATAQPSLYVSAVALPGSVSTFVSPPVLFPSLCDLHPYARICRRAPCVTTPDPRGVLRVLFFICKTLWYRLSSTAEGSSRWPSTSNAGILNALATDWVFLNIYRLPLNFFRYQILSHFPAFAVLVQRSLMLPD